MKLLTFLFLGILLTLYSNPPTLLEKIQSQGVLHVATRPGPTTYYQGRTEKGGLEYDLIQRFAQQLGVKAAITVVEDRHKIISLLTNKKVHFAAAGMACGERPQVAIRFSPGYQQITQQLIYRDGHRPPPKKWPRFTAKHIIYVAPGSFQVNLLKKLQKKYPNLHWQIMPHRSSTELLAAVWKGEIAYTLAHSNEVEYMRHYYPELEIALELPDSQQLAWAFARQIQDDSLYLTAINFFNQLKQSGELARLLERYYGHIDDAQAFDYVNTRVFYRYVISRLPKYRHYFEQMALRYHFDWRLLAAVGYEESQWDPGAVSATGVKGIMMLTQATAEELGVADREDPFQSIEGGTRYLLYLKNRLPDHIPEPDRTWFALAAYNVGFGHLIDAQKLTKQRGFNPYLWKDVKQHLPLLTKRYWYRQTRYGYARGYEPVKFVKHVRRVYDMLMQLEESNYIALTNLPTLYPSTMDSFLLQSKTNLFF